MTHINGPINIVKLKNSSKELYLLFDFHEDVENQTMCLNNNAQDIDSFLSTYLKSVKNDTDFFLEISQNTINEYKESPNSFKERYINNVQKWFSLNNKNSYSKVRFHFMDIRQSFDHLPETDFLFMTLTATKPLIIYFKLD